MKIFFLIISVLFFNKTIFSQTKIITLDEKEIKWVGTPLLDCSKKATINIETNDTIEKYIVLSFRNAKYTHIVDSRIILFRDIKDNDDLIKFKKDLNTAIENIDSADPITFKGENYEIYITGGKSIWLYDTKNGYTGFFLKQALKLKEWIDKTEL